MKANFKLAALASALALSQAAWATGPVQADIGALTPDTGNTTAAANWRFAPGQTFGGVAGALDGVARLSFTAASDGLGYACSGSLLAGGQYVLTAAHCADDFVGTMKVDFGWYNGTAAVTRNVTVANAIVHPLWQGFDNSADRGIDLAILKLDAPVTTIAGYKISTTNDVGKQHLVAGYGTTQIGSSNSATNWNDSAYGHWGMNTFDVTSQAFNQAIGTWTAPNGDAWAYDAGFYLGATYMVDFDRSAATSTSAQKTAFNALGKLAAQFGNAWTSDEGVGPNESLIAGGDSGGGDFVLVNGEWVLSGVHSWGWNNICGYFAQTSCAVANNNGSSYGDVSGSTATFTSVGWINSVVNPAAPVPEPETYGLMLAGLALVAGVARRRRA